MRLGILAVLIFLGLLLMVWSHMEFIHLGYEMTRLAKEKEALIKREEELRVELATLTSQNQLERRRKALPLIRPGKDQMIILKEEGR